MTALAFCALAGLGTLGRWQMGRLNVSRLPRGTLALNVGAAFVLGLLAESSPSTLTVVGVGLLGSVSTFSTVAREVVEMSSGEQTEWAARYLGVTLILGIAAALVGLQLAAL